MSTDLELRVHAWLVAQAPAEVPADLVARVAAIPRAEPRPGGLRSTIAAAIAPWSAGRLLSAPGLAAAVLTVVLATGGLLLVVAIRSPMPPGATPSPLATPTFGRVLPAQLPPGVPGGTVDTPIGRARWLHMSGDRATLADPAAPPIGDIGLAWFANGRVWTSDDLLAPKVERWLPPLQAGVVANGLGLVGDTYWLMTSDPVRPWRSHDLANWEQIDPTDLAPPSPTDLWDTPDLLWPVTSGGVTLVQARYFPKDPGRLLGHPGRRVWPERVDSNAYRVMGYDSGSGDEVELSRVRIDETGTGLRVSNEQGATISELSDVGLEVIDAWGSFPDHRIEARQLAVLDGARLRVVELPAGVPVIDGLRFFERPTVYPTRAGFLALDLADDGTVRTWRSENGESWIEGDRLGERGGQPWRVDSVQTERFLTPGALVADLSDGSGQWQSLDGETWTFVELPRDEFDYLYRLPAGWLRADIDGDWSASVDGDTWQPAAELGRVISKFFPVGGGGNHGALIGNAVFFGVDEDDGAGPSDLWIVEFEP